VHSGFGQNSDNIRYIMQAVKSAFFPIFSSFFALFWDPLPEPRALKPLPKKTALLKCGFSDAGLADYC
jgi:hypothetical protein